ncbi:putative translation initiation factor IF-2, partial [Nocardioidaceae bacterium Broad-1]
MTLPAEADVAICGAGPIGAATATFLARPGLRVVLIDHDPADDPGHVATYRYAGGSIRWTWPDPVKREMTTQTEKYIRGAAPGADLGMIENTYHLLHTGEHIPALNVSTTGLVGMLRDHAREAGATLVDALVTGVRPDGSGHVVETSRGTIRAGGSSARWARRTPRCSRRPARSRRSASCSCSTSRSGPNASSCPTRSCRSATASGYVFREVHRRAMRVLVGQEDIVEGRDTSAPSTTGKEILDSVLAETLPWLRDARVDD